MIRRKPKGMRRSQWYQNRTLRRSQIETLVPPSTRVSEITEEPTSPPNSEISDVDASPVKSEILETKKLQKCAGFTRKGKKCRNVSLGEFCRYHSIA